MDDVANMLPIYKHREFHVNFMPSDPVGDGNVDNYSSDVSKAEVGICGISGNHQFSFARVDDLSFTRVLVALMHEYGHYELVYDDACDKLECAISEASVVGNLHYYLDKQREFPHEIAAESKGVMHAWDAMTDIFPEFADECMLDYINFRADKTSYMIPHRDGGYTSKDDVEKAFKAAMTRSLKTPREPRAELLRYPDESIRLLMQGCERWNESPNAYHINKLIGTMPGKEKDKMMASLTIHLHPEILSDLPILQGEDFNIGHIFGKPLVVDTLPPRYSDTVKALDDAQNQSGGTVKRKSRDGPNVT